MAASCGREPGTTVVTRMAPSGLAWTGLTAATPGAAARSPCTVLASCWPCSLPAPWPGWMTTVKVPLAPGPNAELIAS